MKGMRSSISSLFLQREKKKKKISQKKKKEGRGKKSKKEEEKGQTWKLDSNAVWYVLSMMDVF